MTLFQKLTSKAKGFNQIWTRLSRTKDNLKHKAAKLQRAPPSLLSRTVRQGGGRSVDRMNKWKEKGQDLTSKQIFFFSLI